MEGVVRGKLEEKSRNHTWELKKVLEAMPVIGKFSLRCIKEQK